MSPPLRYPHRLATHVDAATYRAIIAAAEGDGLKPAEWVRRVLERAVAALPVWTAEELAEADRQADAIVAAIKWE